MWAAVTALLALTLLWRQWQPAAGTGETGRRQGEPAAGAVTVTIPVDGMICVVCAASVKRTAQAVNGVRAADVDLARRRATVSYIDGKTSPEQIAAAIAGLGYHTGPPLIENLR